MTVQKRTGNKKRIYVYSLIILMVFLVISLCTGRYPLEVREIGRILSGQGADETAKSVFLTLRLPRTVMAFIAGAGLSMAGSIYQDIFRNPLASPDLIGVTSGAGAGAAFAIVCFGQGGGMVVGSAFAGGLVAVGAAVALAGMAGHRSASDFVLAGIAVRALADSFIMAMKYLADPERQLASIEYWTMGSFSSMTYEKLMTAAPVVLAGLIGLLFFRWQIQMLSLADDEAAMLGVSVKVVRISVLALTTLIVAGIVSVTGAISFIGLVAPHIARMLLKENGFSAAVLSGLVGSIIMLAADCLARSLGGSEIPVSILTSLLGVPVFLWLIAGNGNKP